MTASRSWRAEHVRRDAPRLEANRQAHEQRHQAQAGRPVQLAPETERLLRSLALPRALRRAGLATSRQWLLVLERVLQTAGLLSERTRRTVWQAQHGQPRHVAAREPGELVS